MIINISYFGIIKCLKFTFIGLFSLMRMVWIVEMCPDKEWLRALLKPRD